MTADILAGIAAASAPEVLAATALGSLIGLVVGMIPGLTISTGIVLLLPFTFSLDPMVSIAILLGVYAAGMTGGSFSAILINIPGTPSASATGLDGYPMARRGEAGRALGISIAASFFGGVVSFLCLALVAPLLAEVALGFRTPDMFALLVFGLSVICSFAGGSVVNALIAAALGLLIGTIGQDPVMGTARFTFGDPDMLGGIHFLPAMIGLFAVPQLVENLAPSGDVAAHAQAIARGFAAILPRRSDLVATAPATAIGSAIGAVLGVMPGIGGPIAAFIAYDAARKIHPHPETFGEGAPEGVAAPEAANNAVTGAALIPMMTLGIPGDPITAILIGALAIHGLAPGPLMFIERADFAYGLMMSFLWANVLGLVIALAVLRPLVRLLSIPRTLMMPVIAVLCATGSYALSNNLFDVWVMLAFGVLALAMRWTGLPVVPLLIALVLGPDVEESMRVALTGARGDVTIFVSSPVSVACLALAAASVLFSLRPRGGTRRTSEPASAAGVRSDKG